MYRAVSAIVLVLCLAAAAAPAGQSVLSEVNQTPVPPLDFEAVIGTAAVGPDVFLFTNAFLYVSPIFASGALNFISTGIDFEAVSVYLTQDSVVAHDPSASLFYLTGGTRTANI